MEGIFEMANCNTLLALAYIRESDNPLRVFCNLILYCLSISSEQKLRHDELKGKMKDVFGLSVPNFIIDSCVKYLLKQKAIEKLPNGAGYRLLDSKFDVEQFETEKKMISYNENLLIDELITYVSNKFDLSWSRDEAYKNLSDLILNEKTTTDIVEDIFVDDASKDLKYIQPTWYVKKYIIELLEQRSGASYEYFLNVFNGTLVLKGLLQTNDYNQDKEQKFRGTTFYFDTKILLRILGFSLPYLCETTKELLNLITKEYGGKIGVFSHVISEIRSAIAYAENDMNTKGYVDNFEFDYFQRENQYSAEDFRIAKESVEDRLKNEFGFVIIDDIDWNAQKTSRYYFDEEKLTAFLKDKNSGWKSGAIRNDVRSVLYVNIAREGDYTAYFGGKRKLPVIVTSNTKLFFDLKNYANENLDNDNFIAPWTHNKLPVITDSNLMSRLWLTSKCKDEITLSLAKAAFLFQQSDAAFYEKIKSTYKAVQEKHSYNIVDLDHERFEKLKEEIIDKTNGNLEEIDENVVATSFEELANRVSEEKDKTIKVLSEGNESVQKSLNDMEKDYIESCARHFSNKVNFFSKTVMFIIKNSPTIVALLGIIAIWVIDYRITAKLLNSHKLFSFIPLGLALIFEFVDKKVLSDSLIAKLCDKYKNCCKKQYISNIKKKLSEKERRFEDEIIECSIKNTKFFN